MNRRANDDRWMPVGPGLGDGFEPEQAGEWRWRNYTDHLGDLGYELEGDTPLEGAEADELAQAVAEYRRRSRPAG